MTTNSAELKPFELRFDAEGERIAFDGVDEWAFPATYRRLVSLAKAMAIELNYRRTAAQGEQAGSAEQVSEREHFEKWAAPYGYSLELASCGCCAYQSEDTQNAYMGYSAALSAPERKQGEQAAPEFNTKEPK